MTLQKRNNTKESNKGFSLPRGQVQSGAEAAEDANGGRRVDLLYDGS